MILSDQCNTDKCSGIVCESDSF